MARSWEEWRSLLFGNPWDGEVGFRYGTGAVADACKRIASQEERIADLEQRLAESAGSGEIATCIRHVKTALPNARIGTISEAVVNALAEIEGLRERLAEAEAHIDEITRRFKAVAIHTRDDRDYDLTYVAGAIQDARSWIQRRAQGGDPIRKLRQFDGPDGPPRCDSAQGGGDGKDR